MDAQPTAILQRLLSPGRARSTSARTRQTVDGPVAHGVDGVQWCLYLQLFVSQSRSRPARSPSVLFWHLTRGVLCHTRHHLSPLQTIAASNALIPRHGHLKQLRARSRINCCPGNGLHRWETVRSALPIPPHRLQAIWARNRQARGHTTAPGTLPHHTTACHAPR